MITLDKLISKLKIIQLTHVKNKILIHIILINNIGIKNIIIKCIVLKINKFM
jgi:hypothetical protein